MNRTDGKIQQLIEDIELNEWYCDVGFGESSLLDWEKSLIIEGLKGLSYERKRPKIGVE